MTSPDRRVTRYVRRTVHPYSAYYRDVLDRARGQFELVPPTDLGDITDPGALVLRPDLGTIVRKGRRRFAARALLAKTAGGMHQFNRRVVEHDFKPVHWVIGDGVPLGYSTADLQRLASYGKAWLERAGVQRHDVVLSLLHPGPSVAHWQLVLGCRRSGVSAIHLDPAVDPEWAERLAPSVLAGDPQQLVAILARSRESGHKLANLKTVLAVGDPLSAELRTRLQTLSGATVVGAWAPAGVRAVWTECREAAERMAPTGYHTWDDDFLEVVPAGGGGAAPTASSSTTGELLWTGLGWRGSAVLRLRTYTSVTVDRATCAACGQASARIMPREPVPRIRHGEHPPVAAESEWSPGAATETDGQDTAVVAPIPVEVPVEVAGVEAVLDAEVDVSSWQVEYRVSGGEPETLVVLAPAWGAAVVPLIRRLDRHLSATQFIVLTADEVAQRVDTSGGRRILGEPAEPRP